MTVTYRALIGPPGAGWVAIPKARLKTLEPGTMLATTSVTPSGSSTVYDCYRPPRRRDESPVQYYARTKVVDDNFARGHDGWYYCNPAHCKRRWRDKAERNKHLEGAYGALD